MNKEENGFDDVQNDKDSTVNNQSISQNDETDLENHEKASADDSRTVPESNPNLIPPETTSLNIFEIVPQVSGKTTNINMFEEINVYKASEKVFLTGDNPMGDNSVEEEPKKAGKAKILVAGLALAAIIGGGSGYLASNIGQDYSFGNFASSKAKVERSSGDYVPSEWGSTIDKVADSVASFTIYKDDNSGGYGSGVIISKDGYILTNNHVISGAKKISVGLRNGSIYTAKVVGADPTTDLAIVALKNAPNNLPTATFANSDNVSPGDDILAVGNPLGLSQTSTTGIVSAVDRPVTSNQENDSFVYTNAIQIDAAINPGNSGGPLFNSQGEVIGITSSIATIPGAINNGSSGSIGIGFAIPSNQAAKVSDSLIATGKASHALLGAKITNGEATVGKTKVGGGRIVEITKGAAAEKAGLKKDDVVIALDGEKISSSDALTASVREYSPNDKVSVKYVRNGKSSSVDVKFDELTVDKK